MITFEAIDAGHGDALLVRYMGDMDFERIILIDGGPSSTGVHNGNAYSPLRETILPRLAEVKAERDANGSDIKAGSDLLTIDLAVCTHVHDDHIDGVVGIFGGLSQNAPTLPGMEILDIPRIWHNSFSKLIEGVDIDAATLDEAVSLSVPDGENLTSFAGSLGTDVNKGAKGKLIGDEFEAKGFGPAIITVLNPGAKELVELKKEWAAKTRKLKSTDAVTQSAGEKELKEFKEDKSVLNLSSITMLVEWKGRKILLTGDQRGDYVMRGLEARKLKQKGKPFHVDVMKVPHHGSKANVQRKFIAGVPADIYVFSANGKDQNPDPEVLDIVASEAKSGRKFTMAFTNEAMNYVPLDEVLPSFVGGPKVATLREAIAHLRQDPDIAANVTFEFRKPGARSLVYSLPAKP